MAIARLLDDRLVALTRAGKLTPGDMVALVIAHATRLNPAHTKRRPRSPKAAMRAVAGLSTQCTAGDGLLNAE